MNSTSLTHRRFMYPLRSGLLILLIIATLGRSQNLVMVTDRSGAARDSLQIEHSGDERLISAVDLARAVQWPVKVSGTEVTISAIPATVTLRAGNAFVKVGDKFVQLRRVPEERNGIVWLPLPALPDLFPGAVTVDSVMPEIRVLSLEAAPIPVLPPSIPAAGTEAHWTLKTVIVDPGHGGKDPGAIGLANVQEKHVTLDIARRLAQALRDSGLTVELTRNADNFVSLQQRTRLANEKQGDVFISIHCNSHRDKSVRGIETYFLSPARTSRAIEAALKENSVVDLEDDTSGYQPLTEASFILQSMATSQNLRDSEAWAAAAERAASLATGLESRGVDQAGFYVLMGASMPALLVECGFLSHARDVALLSSASGRQKLANALAASILSLKTRLETSSTR